LAITTLTIAGFGSDIFIAKLGPVFTGIENEISLPLSFNLHQNYPNPFNPSTTIQFALPQAEFVTLKIYNVLGEEVATLLSASLLSGSYKYEWDASHLASGVYLYRLETNNSVETETRKMMLMK
jgi:hypothetical protein